MKIRGNMEISLPVLPPEREAAEILPAAVMERAMLVADKLVFEHPGSLNAAIKMGFFLIEIPREVDVAAGDRFCHNFFKEKNGSSEDGYRGYRQLPIKGNFQGYFDRELDQWETLMIGHENQKLLPADVAGLGDRMSAMGVVILKAVLEFVGIPKKSWTKVTGGLSNGGGYPLLGFNHFRANKPTRGSSLHRDSGWVTILRSTQRGMCALIDECLFAINPEPGYFIVNFGRTIELLTRELELPVRGNIHGVVRTQRAEGEPNRTSYASFLESALDSMVYKYEEGKVKPVAIAATFLAGHAEEAFGGITKINL